MSKLTTESLAKPVILRGSDNERPYIHQEIQTVQYGAVVGQVNLAHQPPTVTIFFLFIPPLPLINTDLRYIRYNKNKHKPNQPFEVSFYCFTNVRFTYSGKSVFKYFENNIILIFLHLCIAKRDEGQ